MRLKSFTGSRSIAKELCLSVDTINGYHINILLKTRMKNNAEITHYALQRKLLCSPDVGGERYEMWARLATFRGRKNRGSWFVPDPDDEVLVAFVHGDFNHPVVIGFLWNGSDRPPESKDDADKNERKVPCSNDIYRTGRNRRK